MNSNLPSGYTFDSEHDLPTDTGGAFQPLIPDSSQADLAYPADARTARGQIHPIGTAFRDSRTGEIFFSTEFPGTALQTQPRRSGSSTSSSPAFDPSQPFEVLSYGPTSYEDPAPLPTGSSPFHQPRRRFTPEQLRSFAALSGLGPAMAAESLPLRIAATNAAAARIETSGDRGYFITPTSTGRKARENEPSAPIEGHEPPANEPSAVITVPHQAGRPSAVVTVPRPTPRPSAVVTVPQPTGRPSAIVSVPRDLMQPQSSPDPSSPHDGGIMRTVSNGTNSVFRGAISEGYQQAAEGLYNMLGSILGRNPHSNTSTPDLRIHLRIAEQKLAVEEAAIKARLKRQPRGFAPPPDYGKLKDTIRSITDELNSRHGNGESFIHSLRSFVESTQEEAARQRQVTRDFFDVDDDFANSAAGNILEGFGSLATLPLNASVAGLPVTIAQTYQGGYDDYVQSRERQGLPVNRDEAERAAATYLATVGPAEALLDKFVVGRILTSMKGKATVGQTLTKLGIIGASGGLTNAADQAYLNALAKHLQGYDLERTLDQGVLESFAFGTVLSGVGGRGEPSHAIDGSHASFDPEKIDSYERPYYIVTPGAKTSPPPAVATDKSSPNNPGAKIADVISRLDWEPFFSPLRKSLSHTHIGTPWPGFPRIRTVHEATIDAILRRPRIAPPFQRHHPTFRVFLNAMVKSGWIRSDSLPRQTLSVLETEIHNGLQGTLHPAWNNFATRRGRPELKVLRNTKVSDIAKILTRPNGSRQVSPTELFDLLETFIRPRVDVGKAMQFPLFQSKSSGKLSDFNMTGLHLWFTALEANAKPFLSFGEGFISDYSRSNQTHRLHIRDAFHTDILSYAEQCERHGYQLVDFQFAIDREDSVHEFIPAYEITYQDFAFFEDTTKNSWQGNEQRPIEIHDGAWIVETANQIVCVEEVASTLKSIRPDFQWRRVETIDKFKRRFWRLIPKPEHSFVSRIPFVDGDNVFDWIAAAAEPPDDLFFDTIATGTQAAYYPLIASRAVARELERIYPDFPLFPIYPPNSETSRSVMRTFELLKPRIRRLPS